MASQQLKLSDFKKSTDTVSKLSRKQRKRRVRSSKPEPGFNPGEPIFCKNCARLKTEGNPLPFCEWLKAYLDPSLLSQAWECEGYQKAKGVE